MSKLLHELPLDGAARDAADVALVYKASVLDYGTLIERAQPLDRAAAANLDVIAMRAETEHGLNTGPIERQRKHPDLSMMNPRLG